MFDLGLILMVFVVDKVSVGHVSFRVLRYFPIHHHSINAVHSFTHRRDYKILSDDIDDK